ncbi:hypothetical protein EDB87DRAFT_1671127 [Lactarius vividus]|nr:hypothetical protein EDB87DRAFT_1671127 [Lactarius vividus]
MLSAIAARKARQQIHKSSTKRRQSHHTKPRKRSRSENKHDSGTALTSYSDDDLDQEDIAPPQPAQPEQRKAWSPSRLVFDSSDDGSDPNETPLPELPRFPSSITISQVKNLNEGSSLGLTRPAVALVLFPSATVSFVGTYRLRVLRGSVSLLGTIVRPSQVGHQVVAPYSSPIPVIQALVAPESLQSHYLISPLAFLAASTKGTSWMVLQELQSGVDGLGRIVRTFEGVFDDVHPKGIPTTQAVRGLRAFRLLPSWEAALYGSPFSSSSETVSKPLVLLVKGQKNSGKSTFARLLVNRLISRYRRVAFLECDIGQSEFTPGGMALVETYRLDLQYATSFVGVEDDSKDDRIVDIIPLVVNTMGWMKGLGIDLARRIEVMVQPTDIFTFGTTPLDGDGVEPHGPQVHALEPVTPSSRFTAADHRALSLLSYFHAVFPDPAHLAPLQQATASAWDTSLPLCAQPPYELTSQLALDRIVLTGAGAEDVVRPELVRVLAGALVALVSDAAPSRSDSEELYTPGTPPPDPASSSCLGLALVRGVSGDGSKLQLLTPVPPETLVNARVLVMGELRLPVWGWLDFRSADGEQTGADDVPFLSWGRSAGAGGERRRVRRNIMRRAQM